MVANFVAPKSGLPSRSKSHVQISNNCRVEGKVVGPDTLAGTNVAPPKDSINLRADLPERPVVRLITSTLDIRACGGTST